MEAHWENSSSNSIVKDILEHSNETTRAEIEALISGGCVEKPLISGLTYADFDNRELQKRQMHLWSVLFATGYLTDLAEPVGKVHRLVIPNREILEIYKDRILSWFETKTVSNTERWQKFCAAVKEGAGEKDPLRTTAFVPILCKKAEIFLGQDGIPVNPSFRLSDMDCHVGTGNVIIMETNGL